MNRKYFGDSYDAVKRMWKDLLQEWAPLYADPRFIPDELRQDYTRLTRIPVAISPLSKPYSILNDPDTGIRLPSRGNQRTGRTHTSIEEIAEQLKTPSVKCVITFDQSAYRQLGISPKDQRLQKIGALFKT